MEQSISFKIGKGSIAHNARDFTASNVDSNRSQYNIEYVNKDLKQNNILTGVIIKMVAPFLFAEV